MKYVETVYKTKPEHFDNLVDLLKNNLFPKAVEYGATRLQVSVNPDEGLVIGHGNYPAEHDAIQFGQVIAAEMALIEEYCQELPKRSVYDAVYVPQDASV